MADLDDMDKAVAIAQIYWYGDERVGVWFGKSMWNFEKVAESVWSAAFIIEYQQFLLSP